MYCADSAAGIVLPDDSDYAFKVLFCYASYAAISLKPRSHRNATQRKTTHRISTRVV